MAFFRQTYSGRIFVFVSCLVFLSAARNVSSLKIVGAGLPRTGTHSLYEALNLLGYKTYHMIELIQGRKIRDFELWTSYFRGDLNVSDFADEIYAEYDAAVDFPTANAWQDLAAYYPDSVVILTERASSELWWESVRATVISDDFFMSMLCRIHPLFRAVRETATHAWKKDLGWSKPEMPNDSDRDAMIEFYTRNSQAARAFDPKRTLIFDVRQGWEPLCAFLGKPVPDVPFPKGNTRREFRHRLLKIMAVSSGIFLVTVVIAGFALRFILSLRGGKEKLS